MISEYLTCRARTQTERNPIEAEFRQAWNTFWSIVTETDFNAEYMRQIALCAANCAAQYQHELGIFDKFLKNVFVSSWSTVLAVTVLCACALVDMI